MWRLRRECGSPSYRDTGMSAKRKAPRRNEGLGRDRGESLSGLHALRGILTTKPAFNRSGISVGGLHVWRCFINEAGKLPIPLSLALTSLKARFVALATFNRVPPCAPYHILKSIREAVALRFLMISACPHLCLLCSGTLTNTLSHACQVDAL